MQQNVSQTSREDYLAQDAAGGQKHEFYRGEVFAMAGGTFRHADIAGNVLTALRLKLRGKSCRAMNSDMRLHTPSGLDTYPDVSAFCGAAELTDKDTTLLNPVLIIEVLSPSTRDYDKGGKFTLYRSILSLRDYLLVDSEELFVEHFRRSGGEWVLHEYREWGDEVPLASIGESLALADIYEDVVFDRAL
jgi:Uma2 family endonuclease